ncbi:MAG: hypothetical protein IH597_15050 [Bacteroidales bacterium]|nr:hypothetical protein [Bacteroidales bacterium]
MKKEEIETMIQRNAELEQENQSLRLYRNSLDIERQSLFNENRDLRNVIHEQDIKIRQLKEDAKLNQVLSTIDAMTVLKSATMMLSYVGEDGATHRQKHYHTERAIEMLNKSFNEKFESIKDHFDRERLPF